MSWDSSQEALARLIEKETRMRRTDPTDPETGSAEWVELRQQQTQQAGHKTTRFQPHRQDGKRSERARITLPGSLIPALALMGVLLLPLRYAEAVKQDPGMSWEVSLNVLFTFTSAWILMSWIRRAVRWLKDKD